MKKPSIFNLADLSLMSKINDYIDSQPRFSTEGLIPLFLNQRPAGWLENHIAVELGRFSNIWQCHTGTIQLQGASLAEQLQLAVQHLHQQGYIQGWRNENYGVCIEDKHGEIDFSQPLCALERASFRRFGLVSRAVHINAYYPDGTICLGKRAPSKSIDPDRLDNMAAGGIPINESIYNCAIRELAEEAGVPANIAANIKPMASMHILRNESDGTHNEIVYCFDLALPENFIPHNHDGEVAAFYRYSQLETLNRLAEMTWDAGRVTADFLLRQRKK